VAALLFAVGCDRGYVNAEVVVDRAYDAYQAVADSMSASADCSAGVAGALREIERRRGDLDRAFAWQADPDRLAGLRGALEARKDRFLAISASLDSAFGRCEGTPGLDRVSSALDGPADGLR